MAWGNPADRRTTALSALASRFTAVFARSASLQTWARIFGRRLVDAHAVIVDIDAGDAAAPLQREVCRWAAGATADLQHVRAIRDLK